MLVNWEVNKHWEVFVNLVCCFQICVIRRNLINLSDLPLCYWVKYGKEWDVRCGENLDKIKSQIFPLYKWT